MSKDRNIWIFGCFLFTGSIISLLYQMVFLFMVLERQTTRFELEILRRKTWTCSIVWHAFYKTGMFFSKFKIQISTLLQRWYHNVHVWRCIITYLHAMHFMYITLHCYSFMEPKEYMRRTWLLRCGMQHL